MASDSIQFQPNLSLPAFIEQPGKRRNGAKHKCPFITAVQTDGAVVDHTARAPLQSRYDFKAMVLVFSPYQQAPRRFHIGS